jgi:hypothetical protein
MPPSFTPLERLASFQNQLRYGFYKWLYAPRLPTWPPPNWMKLALFESQIEQHTLAPRQQELVENYPLQAYPATLSGQTLYENLAMLDALDVALKGVNLNHAEPQAHWLDVGCKNWAYLPAQVAFAQTLARAATDWTFTGIELDGYRRYANGFFRADYGHLMAKQAPQAQYILGDVMSLQEPKFDVVSCFFPFVFADTLLAWGLCLKYFEPAAMLKHMLGLLKVGGVFLSVHLGQEEAETYGALLESFVSVQPTGSWQLTTLIPLPPTFVPYSEARYACLCRKLL